MTRPPVLRTAVLAALALTAFAANSLLCRAALGGESIGPAAFSGIRIASGAAALFLLLAARQRAAPRRVAGSWASASMLFLYVAGFSYAYVELSTGTGALILFGVVQLTMMVRALQRGERPHAIEWAGMAVALGGLVWLVFPGLSAPSPIGAALMAAAGMGWGVYTLLGRGSTAPLTDTTGNFVRALALAVPVGTVLALAVDDGPVTSLGVLLATTSGALTSGVGYALWYAALAGLTRTRAALLQLSVPAITAIAGVLLLGEALTARLVTAMALVLGGIGAAIAGRR